MSADLNADRQRMADAIVQVHHELREVCLQQCRTQCPDLLASVVSTSGAGDCTFAIDRHVEARLLESLERHLPAGESLVVLHEGQTRPAVVPAGTDISSARWASLWDPLDGSRPLAYQLRPAAILTCVAPNSEQPMLQDAVIAVQTEIPLLNQRTAVSLQVVRHTEAGIRLRGERLDLTTGQRSPFQPTPSTAVTIEGGLIGTEWYFDVVTPWLSALEEAILNKTLGPAPAGSARIWHELQISSSGTFFNLLCGKLRWMHDWRPLINGVLESQGLSGTLCAHIYDVCTFVLLAEATGVIVTDANGQPLDGPLFDLERGVSYEVYANQAIRQQLEATTLEEIRRLLTQNLENENV